MEHALQFLSFDAATKIHFIAQQRDASGNITEHAICEIDGEIIYAIADEIDNISEEIASSLQQAYTFLINNLNVPL